MYTVILNQEPYNHVSIDVADHAEVLALINIILPHLGGNNGDKISVEITLVGNEDRIEVSRGDDLPWNTDPEEEEDADE